MPTEADRLADAIRLNLSSIDESIRAVRGWHRRGRTAPKNAARYLETLRRIYEFSEQAKAVGGNGPLFDNKHQPLALREQLVGYCAEEARSLRWKGVWDSLRNVPVVDPVRFLEAAE